MIKILLLIGLVALVFWMLGAKRSAPPDKPQPPQAKPDTSAPQAMVACAQCGLHLPTADALPGRGGQFCSAAHRAAYEASH